MDTLLHLVQLQVSGLVNFILHKAAVTHAQALATIFYDQPFFLVLQLLNLGQYGLCPWSTYTYFEMLKIEN